MDVVENLEAAIAAVEEARSVPLSASCVINRGEMLQLLDQVKVSFPNDLAKAISILREKEDILENAHKQADGIIAQVQYSALNFGFFHFLSKSYKIIIFILHNVGINTIF